MCHRMMSQYRLLKILLLNMGVYLRREQRRMPEQLLNDSKIGSAEDQCRRKGVAQSVGRDAQIFLSDLEC